MKSDITLALESAVGGGSLAMIVDGNAVATWHGMGRVSRAEELLVRVSELLESNSIDRREITRIAVSNGPGSYTGIRIGLATAMGLSRALDIPCHGIFVLEALELAGGAVRERSYVVPIGRSGYCWQYFEASTTGARTSEPPESGGLADLSAFVNAKPEMLVHAQRDAFDDLVGAIDVGSHARLIDLGRDLAVAIGYASASIDNGLEPLYARENAPKADPKV